MELLLRKHGEKASIGMSSSEILKRIENAKRIFCPSFCIHIYLVKHPGYEYFLEEHWLFEAIDETYIPLLMGFKDLEERGVNFKITVSMTPPLCEMLADDYLRNKYHKHLERMIELCHKEVECTKDDGYFKEVAGFYLDRFSKIKGFFEGFLNYDVLNGYRHFSVRFRQKWRLFT